MPRKSRYPSMTSTSQSSRVGIRAEYPGGWLISRAREGNDMHPEAVGVTQPENMELLQIRLRRLKKRVPNNDPEAIPLAVEMLYKSPIERLGQAVPCAR
jgi:hypothetical protein